MALGEGQAGSTGGRILVVDDEPHMARLCAQILRLDAHIVEMTSRPDDALDILSEGSFDLLLTDLTMPGMSGLELANLASRHDPTVAVVLMTAYRSYENMAAALQQGVADFLPKPFDADDLRLTVMRALQRRRLMYENVRLRTLVDLLEAGQKFARSLDAKEIAASIIQAIRDATGIACVHVAVDLGDSLVDSGVVHADDCAIAALPLAGITSTGGYDDDGRTLRLPLIAAGQTVGAVVIAVPEGSSRRPGLDAVVQMLITQGAAALYNARLYRELAELDRQKDDFIAIASHELRTPLAVVLGYSSMLHHRLHDREREYIGQVVTAGLRMSDIVDDMINLRHLEAGDTMLSPARLDLGELIDTVAQELRPLATTHGVQLEVRRRREPIHIMADREKLLIVLANLVDNAIRFTPSTGRVTVSSEIGTGDQGDPVTITVQDTGIGIAAHKIDRIFDRFYQVSEPRTRQEHGMGIGLTIARGLVQLHQGTIEVQSMPGKGSRFTVRLPSSLRVD